MIRKIEKPNIKFNFVVYENDKFYFDDETNEYINISLEHKTNEYINIGLEHKYYFNLNGDIHRIGKPAIEYSFGDKVWAENNKTSRIDGPAFLSIDVNHYYINGIFLLPIDFAVKTNHLLCQSCYKFCKQNCF